MPNIEIVPLKPDDKVEKRSKLKEAKQCVFRFPTCTYEEAMAGKDDNCFWRIIKTQPEKTGRVTIASLDGQIVLDRDDDHEVILHPVRIQVGEAERV